MRVPIFNPSDIWMLLNTAYYLVQAEHDITMCLLFEVCLYSGAATRHIATHIMQSKFNGFRDHSYGLCQHLGLSIRDRAKIAKCL